MSRPHLSVMGVIYEALGFAASKFSTALRIAWLPLILIMLVEVILSKVGLTGEGRALALKVTLEPGWITKFSQSLSVVPFAPISADKMFTFLGLIGVAAILQASILVPLIRYAGNGEAPHHGSMHLSFGMRHLRFFLAAALSFAAVMVSARFLIMKLGEWFGEAVIPVLNTKVTTFEPGSLHSIAETTESFQGLKTILTAINGWFGQLGINLSALDVMIAAPVALIAIYLILRFMAWPYLVAAGRPNALEASMRLSAGSNIISLFAIALLWIVLSTATLWITAYGLRFIFDLLTTGTEYLIVGYEGFVPETDASTWVRGGIILLFASILIMVQTFLIAFQAGLGGALVHRAKG